MKNTRALCQTAVVAALYVALTTLNPLSWGAIQFRVANMFCALPFKDKKYAPAVLLGIAIANATSPFGPVDVAFGLMAEGVAYLLVVWGPWKKLGILWKAVILSLSVALFIGGGAVRNGGSAVPADGRRAVRWHFLGRGTRQHDDF